MFEKLCNDTRFMENCFFIGYKDFTLVKKFMNKRRNSLLGFTLINKTREPHRTSITIVAFRYFHLLQKFSKNTLYANFVLFKFEIKFYTPVNMVFVIM